MNVCFFYSFTCFFIWFTMCSVAIVFRTKGSRSFQQLFNKPLSIYFFFFRLCIYIKHIYVAFAPNLLALFCLRPEVDAVSYVPVFSKMRVILSSPPTKPADWDVFSLLFSRVKRVFRILRKHIRQLRCKRDTLSSRLGHDRRPPDIHTCLRFTKTGLLHVGLIN